VTHNSCAAEVLLSLFQRLFYKLSSRVN
jgi:hypothetical protein